jgi:hypothetical protein
MSRMKSEGAGAGVAPASVFVPGVVINEPRTVANRERESKSRAMRSVAARRPLAFIPERGFSTRSNMKLRTVFDEPGTLGVRTLLRVENSRSVPVQRRSRKKADELDEVAKAGLVMAMGSQGPFRLSARSKVKPGSPQLRRN